jgi:malonyl-CoA/methylmalonyl-CoA synthetase
MNDNLYTRLVGSAPPDPQRIFLRSGEGLVSYGEAHARSAQLAHALLGLGVEPGDRVAVQVAKSSEAVLLYLACLRAGAVYLPLNGAYTLPELEYFLGDAGPRVLVCDPARLGELLPLAQQLAVRHVVTLAAAGRGGSLSERADAQSGSFLDVPRLPEDLAAILYTSGTTGRSKGAMLSHGNLASNAFALKACWRYTASDELIHALPLFHVHGLFVALNVTLAAGAGLHLLPGFDPGAVLALLPAASVLMGVPTFYTRLLQYPGLTRAACARMRLFISGSAPLLAETHRAFAERTGHAILERYGMTETGMNASNPYDGQRVPGTVGLPLPGVQLRVVDLEQGRPLPAGETGMIEVRGPNVFSGYWRMPDKTRAEFRDDGWFITGDVGLLDARGYLHIVGRGKDLVITGGYNVYPREIEAELDALPGVLESAVIGLPHPDFGEGVTAVVVCKPGAAEAPGAPVPAATPGLEPALLAALRERLAGYKCPKRILFLPELPRNTLGKVQKQLLRERFAGLYGPAGDAAR